MYGGDSNDEDEVVPDVKIPEDLLGEDSVDEDLLISDVNSTNNTLEKD